MDVCPTCGQEVFDASRRRWQIELPFTRPTLTLNGRMHYQVKAKRTAEIREAARDLIALFEVPPMAKVRTSIAYSPRTSARRDPINLIPMLKACEDALVDCGVTPDDTPEYVRSVMPEILPKNDEKRGLFWFVIEEG